MMKQPVDDRRIQGNYSGRAKNSGGTEQWSSSHHLGAGLWGGISGRTPPCGGGFGRGLGSVAGLAYGLQVLVVGVVACAVVFRVSSVRRFRR